MAQHLFSFSVVASTVPRPALIDDNRGIVVTSGKLTLTKDANNAIGVSIAGGAPHCPCIYIVQVFDGSPAAEDGTLAAGDEITAINDISVKGSAKSIAVDLIMASQPEVTILFNKLHIDGQAGQSADIVLKKLKHRFSELVGASASDMFGLSRAILLNDPMVKRLEKLSDIANFYVNIRKRMERSFHYYRRLSDVQKTMGDIFAEIGARETSTIATEAFMQFGDAHRQMERKGLEFLKAMNPLIQELHVFEQKILPDMKLTVKKYLDAKFEYLAYCLKVKELSDEEEMCAAANVALYRLNTGNYDARLVLRCRQLARIRFVKLRSDVVIKLELLDSKRVHSLVNQLKKYVEALTVYSKSNAQVIASTNGSFPVEVDISEISLKYNISDPLEYENSNDEASGMSPTTRN